MAVSILHMATKNYSFVFKTPYFPQYYTYKYDWYTVCPQSPLRVLKNCGAQTNWASHMRFAADYSEALEVFFLIPFKFHYHQKNIQCVHKDHSGFWKIVAHKLIELATCGLSQITAKLWKFFFSSHSNSIITRQTHRCPQSPLGVLKNCVSLNVGVRIHAKLDVWIS
jgi:hypothetical protein